MSIDERPTAFSNHANCRADLKKREERVRCANSLALIDHNDDFKVLRSRLSETEIIDKKLKTPQYFIHSYQLRADGRENL